MPSAYFKSLILDGAFLFLSSENKFPYRKLANPVLAQKAFF
jgi:hypothetical protein